MKPYTPSKNYIMIYNSRDREIIIGIMKDNHCIENIILFIRCELFNKNKTVDSKSDEEVEILPEDEIFILSKYDILGLVAENV